MNTYQAITIILVIMAMRQIAHDITSIIDNHLLTGLTTFPNDRALLHFYEPVYVA